MINHRVFTNSMLLEFFLTPEMEFYFYKKLHQEKKDYVKLKICELLKFLTLSHHTYGDIPFNEEIDDIWHLWILQTIQYKELMTKLPGKKFINHCSNDYPHTKPDDIETNEDKLNKQISFLTSYILNFGHFSADVIPFWPTLTILMETFDFDIHQLNTYLTSLIPIE